MACSCYAKIFVWVVFSRVMSSLLGRTSNRLKVKPYTNSVKHAASAQHKLAECKMYSPDDNYINRQKEMEISMLSGVG